MNLIKKNIKPYLVTFLSVSILSTSLVSCSGDDLNKNENLERHNEFVKKSPNEVDIERIKEMVTPFPIDDVYNSAEAKESMASFVNSISEYYVKGMTYQEFKHSLDPYEGLVNIKPEGDVLLQQGFNYIVGNIEPSEMSGRHIVDAFFSGVSYYEESLTHSLDFNLIDDEEYDSIFSDLFGLDQSNVEAYATNGDGCKWYQIGCHTKWLANTIAEWWNTPAIGDGGMTNGQVVASIVAAVGGITGLIILII